MGAFKNKGNYMGIHFYLLYTIYQYVSKKSTAQTSKTLFFIKLYNINRKALFLARTEFLILIIFRIY